MNKSKYGQKMLIRQLAARFSDSEWARLSREPGFVQAVATETRLDVLESLGRQYLQPGKENHGRQHSEVVSQVRIGHGQPAG